jgi:hypothetical protein
MAPAIAAAIIDSGTFKGADAIDQLRDQRVHLRFPRSVFFAGRRIGSSTT